jgi:deoxyribodipyrimidine photolyase-related protein
MKTISIILPNQLFESNLLLLKLSNNIYLIEDDTYFTKYSFHIQKLIMHRGSMKFYYDYICNIFKDEISNGTKKIFYIDNNKVNNIYNKIFSSTNIIHIYDPIDHDLLTKFNKMATKNKILLNIYDSPLFIETNNDLQSYYDNLKSHTNYIHDNGFYKWQRTRLNILMKDDKPLFGKLSFDHNNRKPFDQIYLNNVPPEPNIVYLSFEKMNSKKISTYLEEAEKYVKKNWPNNFGQFNISEYIYPITFLGAKQMAKQFINKKLKTFGKYEDAVNSNIKFGSHSVLSASLNIGLVTVKYVLKKIMKIFNKLTKQEQKEMIPNVEGFIRQLIGWRSYIRFIYKFHSNDLFETNQFNQLNKLPQSWFDASTGIYPIDLLIKKAEKIAYAHHIERLMFLGNFAFLSQIAPKEIYNWFMICFIDSYEWVMIPNIMGMSQYSSGDIKMMTKPYFSSSNYIKNMSDFKLNQYQLLKIGSKEYYWNEIWDALYYNFINSNKNILKNYYSTGYVIAHWNKKSDIEKKQLLKLAKGYLQSSYAI